MASQPKQSGRESEWHSLPATERLPPRFRENDNLNEISTEMRFFHAPASVFYDNSRDCDSGGRLLVGAKDRLGRPGDSIGCECQLGSTVNEADHGYR
jgi:hypothetical protein